MEQVFANDLILCSIMKNLEFGDLKNCRSVNNLWHRTSRQFFCEVTSINLHKKIKMFMKQGHDELQCVQSYKIHRDSIVYFHKKISRSDCTQRSKPDNDKFQNLLTFLGVGEGGRGRGAECKCLTMSSLIVHKDWESPIKMFPPIIQILSNLQELVLVNCKFDMEWRRNLHPFFEVRSVRKLTLENFEFRRFPLAESEFVVDFFKLFPSLEALSFTVKADRNRTHHSREYVNNFTIQKMFMDHHNQSDLPRLQSLQLSGPNNLLFQTVLDLRLQHIELSNTIRSLGLNVHMFLKLSFRPVTSLLGKVAENLREFSLEIDLFEFDYWKLISTDKPYEVNAPGFPRLEKLNVQVNLFSTKGITGFQFFEGKLNYREMLPAIKNLRIAVGGSHEGPGAKRFLLDEFLPISSQSDLPIDPLGACDSMRNLKFQFPNDQVEKQGLLERIKIQFPNVLYPRIM